MTNLEMLRTATPEQIRDMFCEKHCDCFVCPTFLSDRCKRGKNGVLEWLNDEVNAPKDAPKDDRKDAPREAPKDVFKGWVKLKTINSTIRIDASKIVALGPRLSDAAAASTGAITKVYTIGAEWNPWLVCDTVDEVMEKIKNA